MTWTARKRRTRLWRAALAHAARNKTEGAYARSDLFEKRCALMESWAMSTTGDRFQGTRALMVLSVLPDEAVSRHPGWVATTLFSWRVLRPLWWFGLIEWRQQGEDLDDASWRKSVLFDWFLDFGTDLVRTFGSLH